MPPRSTTGVKGLYRSGDGSWRVDHRWVDVETGEHRRFRKKLPAGTTAAAAKAYARRVMNAILEGTFEADRSDPVTLRSLFDDYLAHLEAHGAAWAHRRRQHVEAMAVILGPTRTLSSIKPADVERMKARLAEGRGPAGLNRYLGTWKVVIGWAADAGIVDRARAAELRAVKLRREPEGRVRWLSEDELRAVREKLDGWLRPIVLTIIGTGARRGEITGLRWRDVDLERDEIILRGERTKTRRSRHVPMSAAVRAVIDDLPRGEPDGFVFPIPCVPQRRGDATSEAWRSFCTAHGIEDLRVHDLRHHAATAMRRAGHGLDVVQAVLGHAAPAMTARYAHLGRADLLAAVTAASDSIDPSPNGLPNESGTASESPAEQGRK